jgi:polyisoprenoid-binding protein YceI
MDLPLAPGRYLLDPTHTQIGFVVTHLGITPIRGMFTRYDGHLLVGDRAETSSLQVFVELASLQSSHPGREEHLQGEDFFHSARHPQMIFTTTSISGAGDRWSFEGPLVLRGVEQPIQLDATLTGRAVFPLDQKEHIGFVARGSLSRSAFGVAPNIPGLLLSDQVVLDLSVQLIAE